LKNRIISIVGRHSCGKTTLIENILPLFVRKGYRVVTIKHGTHEFEMDQEGKDTWRHMQAGAEAVIMSSRSKVALIEKLKGTCSLDELINLFIERYDLLIVEGFKNSDKPKIEVVRKELSEELVTGDAPNLLAVVTDSDRYFPVPKFHLNDYEIVAGFIEKKILLRE